MKRMRSYDEDSASAGEKDFSSSSHHTNNSSRRFYSKGPPDTGRRRPSPAVAAEDDRMARSGSISISSSYDDRGVSLMRKRSADHDVEDGSRRKHDFSDGFDSRRRHGGSSSSLVSPRGGGGHDRDRERERERERDRDRERERERERFCTPRREFPKGFRSERHWSRREDGSGGGSSSWLRFDSRSHKKEVEEDSKSSPREKGGSSSSRGGGMDSGGGGGGGVSSSSRESLRDPHHGGGVKDVKSPNWSRDSNRDSKDSGGEASREVKKSESFGVESGGSASGVGCGSDMEEGELHPDSQNVDNAGDQLAVSQQNEGNVGDNVQPNYYRAHQDDDGVRAESNSNVANAKLLQEGGKFDGKEDGGDGKKADGIEIAKNGNGEMGRVAVCNGNAGSGNVVSEYAVGANDGNLRGSQHQHSTAPTTASFTFQSKAEAGERIDQPLPEKEKPKNDFDLEVGFDESSKAAAEEGQQEPESGVAMVKDKGKGVAVCSPGEVGLGEDNLLIERNFIACRDDAMEGSSARGFELFSRSAGVKVESANRSGGSKGESEKLKLEPLDLSLGLPNVSVPTASNNVVAPVNIAAPPSNVALAQPSSPSRARSVQSFGTTLRTGSDCFTTSISFSGSQFIHNPSCSLTHNSMDCDFEQSVKSRPLFQGVDWQALSANDPLPKEIHAKQKLASNGNGSVQFSHASQGILNGRAIQQQGVTPVLDRPGSFQRQPSGKSWYQEDHRSPAQSAGSHETRSEYGKEKKRFTGEESVSRLFRSSSQRDMEPGVGGERELVERMIYLITSESIQAMAWRVNEMSERAVTFLKDTVCEIVLKEDNRGKLRALQDVLRKRSDLDLETMLKSHRVQLQILVSLKTGLSDFIQRADSVSSSDLAEIFLNLKCRNSNCRSALPVDECDCKFCSQKEGFCSSCMCLICSKFDTASNTCGWVGCDVCNHWCHTDCGLQKSYIKNGRSASTAQGKTEMQFYCVACEHPSEMFGFVKDVFKTCATEWKAETLLKELEYVRRIFTGSNDTRGRMLHDAAKQLAVRLQTGANAVEVCQQVLGFLNESDAQFSNAVGSSGREHQYQTQTLEKNRGVVGDPGAALGQLAMWSKAAPAKELSRVDSIGVSHPSMEGKSGGGSSWNPEMMMSMTKKPVVDELDSIIKIKQAEAEMFQKRADDARREAEGLQRIAITKSEKIEEEYANRISKLRLSEVEDRRRQKQEELQVLEKSHREYFNMKTRMETDIKDLLFKMETTRRNLST